MQGSRVSFSTKGGRLLGKEEVRKEGERERGRERGRGKWRGMEERGKRTRIVSVPCCLLWAFSFTVPIVWSLQSFCP